ncbi:uncharacterized protein LOC109613619 [Musca domestica]|uniref:Uncharacterized protein LOC109613619 n=1 Tax=Musca domestica TaxID=7370 RepID=A0A9J7DL92_MUSDO|nr:uncharacterized protein LOC109613619 [Musca domestica]
MHMKLFFIVVLLILPTQAAKKKSRNIYYLGTKDEANPKYLRQFQVNISKARDSMNILVEFGQDVRDMWLTVGVGLWQRSNKNFRSIFSYDIDLCDTLKRIKSSKIEVLKVWLSNLFKYGNLSTDCPFYKSVYLFRNFKFDKDSIPTYIPAGKYQTHLCGYRKKMDGSKDIVVSSYLTYELK